ncbi:alpha-1,2-Mannosidase [Mycena chlorophos]|uniref:alpha-1,2-Mannosidase n=1 Tax=Mycena chlorophos TaxID=658473 RepID=A0A8H6VZL9_MYCCL|nr:alpha-1,2-Mannosidase [Mycena chlorophos]
MVRRTTQALTTVLGLSSSALAGVVVQKLGLTVPPRYAGQDAAVKKIFTESWGNYSKYAFGHDELTPISMGGNDDLGGWGATIVDALGTQLVMGLESEFQSALNYTLGVNFAVSPEVGPVSVFETTIRWVAGMLSAYELSDKKYPELIKKTEQVANQLANAWVGNNTIPYNEVIVTNSTPQVGLTNIAQAGTLSLEWYTLSKYSGNQTYADLGVNSARTVAGLGTQLPGLPPQIIDPATNEFADLYVTWSGGSDSYFEYLIKFARLTNTDDTIWADTWATAVDSSIKNLLKVSTVGDFWYLADRDDDELIRHVGSHLACFYAGNWLYGGTLLRNQTIVDIALKLDDACWNTYASTQTGIGPETFAFVGKDGNYTGGSPPTAEQQAFYNKHGYYITGSDYIQRPEVLESNFYAWRITGNTKYLDRAVSAIESFNKWLTVPGGFASLNDVNDFSAGYIDIMESFWFAEVLKYLYLTFDDPNHISLNDYVLNTECHPIQAPPALNQYGSGKMIPHKPFAGVTKSTMPRPVVSPIRGN